MKKLALSLVIGFGFAVCSVQPGDAHPKCRQECFDGCVEIYRSCLEECNKKPEENDEAKKCRDGCMASPEYHECEEHCDEEHHDPSC